MLLNSWVTVLTHAPTSPHWEFTAYLFLDTRPTKDPMLETFVTLAFLESTAGKGQNVILLEATNNFFHQKAILTHYWCFLKTPLSRHRTTDDKGHKSSVLGHTRHKSFDTVIASSWYQSLNHLPSQGNSNPGRDSLYTSLLFSSSIRLMPEWHLWYWAETLTLSWLPANNLGQFP